MFTPTHTLPHQGGGKVIFSFFETAEPVMKNHEENKLVGVMGIQPVQDVTLIRHAYVRTAKQNQGIAQKLLSRLRKEAMQPILIGTWAAAVWAIRFYEKHGFKLVSPEEKDRLLRKYWSIPERQISTSVVLAEEKWFEQKVR